MNSFKIMVACLMQEWIEIASFFNCSLKSFFGLFEEEAQKIETKGTDGKVRRSYFFRGFYITPKWRKVNGKWVHFHSVSAKNPTLPFAKRTSACVGCAYYEEGVRMKECAHRKDLAKDKASMAKVWNAMEQDGIEADYRNEWEASNGCPVLEGFTWEKVEPRVFPEVDPIPAELALMETKERKAKIAGGIRALDKRDMESFRINQNALIDWMDNTRIEEFKQVLKEEKLLILTKDGKFNIVTARYDVTDTNVSTSLMHMRDILRIDTDVLKRGQFGTLMGHMAGLEKKTISIEPMKKVEITANKPEKGVWMIYGPGIKPKKQTKEVKASNNIPMLLKLLGKELIPGFKFEALLEPKIRLTYDVKSEWDYGNEENEGVSEDQIRELVEHFNGKKSED